MIIDQNRTPIEVSIIAHRLSEIPQNIRFIPVDPMDCPLSYIDNGDGVSKWVILSAETAIQSALYSVKDIDIIHDQSSSVSATTYAIGMGIPVLRTVRLMPFHPSHALTAKTHSISAHLSCYSKSRDRWTPPHKRIVIRDSISIPSEIDRFTANTRFAVSVGRVEERKGHHIAAEIAAEIGIPLLVIGEIIDSEYARQLESKFRVHCKGAMQRRQALGVIEAADLLLWTPTIPEPGGRVIIEALRLGTKVIGPMTGYMADLKPKAYNYDDRFFIIERLPEFWPKCRTSVAASYLRVYSHINRQ